MQIRQRYPITERETIRLRVVLISSRQSDMQSRQCYPITERETIRLQVVELWTYGTLGAP